MPAFGPFRWKSFRSWLKEPLGQTLIEEETKEVEELINKLFGYHLLLLGDYPFETALQSSSILNRIWIHPHIIADADFAKVFARLDKLPILSDEIDLVYLAHCLEFLRNPHEALRETYRVLKPEGHVVLSCFNPWSFWGLWRALLHFIKRVPWDGHFISLHRLKDWMALLGFDVIDVRRYFYRPPFQKKSWLNNFLILETLGQWCWPFFSGCHVILAKKRVITLTPVREKFKMRRREIATGLVEPASRVNNTLLE